MKRRVNLHNQMTSDKSKKQHCYIPKKLYICSAIDMKWNELKKIAEVNGWYLMKHGKKHDIYVHPTNRDRLIIGRHGSEEVAVGTYMKLLKQMGLKINETNK